MPVVSIVATFAVSLVVASMSPVLVSIIT